jgi:opacity protein-like surface antigen
MKKIILIVICIFLMLILCHINNAFSQIKEEQQEKTEKVKKIMIDKEPYKLSKRAYLFFGYDNNVNLSNNRKGDIFEEFLFSLDFSKPWLEDISFSFDYDLDVLNYNQYTDLSNILNHFRFGLHKRLSSLFSIGSGYDLGIFYYHHGKDNDFLFHRGFAYIEHRPWRRMYHRLTWESGLKDYLNNKTLQDTISTYQDKERKDRRSSIEYSLASLINPKLRFQFKSKFSLNDSNARYLDFYDYKSYTQSLGIDYKLSKVIRLLTNFAYRKKEYSARTIISGGDKQEDNLYSGSLGLIYQLNKNKALSLHYTYRENSSNEPLEEYSESVITCGLRYNF